MPRNKSQQFRPAGTRVALPGTNVARRVRALLGTRRKNKRERLLQDVSSRVFFREAMKPLRKKLFCVINRSDAAVEILCFAQEDKF